MDGDTTSGAADSGGTSVDDNPAFSQQLLGANTTIEVLNDAADISTGLESLAARAAILPSLPQHRVAASSVLLIALLILALALIILAVRRPMWRARAAQPPLEHEWAPIAQREAGSLGAAGTPGLQLPAVPRESPASASRAYYNTFGGTDGDAAWQAAKRDWYNAIAQARRLQSDAGSSRAATNGHSEAAGAGGAPAADDEPG